MHYTVYECPSCRHIDYVQGPRANHIQCGFCGQTVDSSMFRASVESEEAASSSVTTLVSKRLLSERRIRPKRGLGVRRRVLDIVSSQIDLNRGRATTIRAVLSESVDAGIDSEKALKFLERLDQEGIVRIQNDRVELAEAADRG